MNARRAGPRRAGDERPARGRRPAREDAGGISGTRADLPGRPWALTGRAVAASLGVDAETGLTGAEAADRLGRYGPNALPAERPHGAAVRFLRQLHSPLIYVLLAATAGSFLSGDRLDALVILAVVIANAVVGFVQESRAEGALAALAALTETVATVVRDGRRRAVPSSALVPGDVVVLETGDKVPADLRLLEARELRVDESVLTGESAPAGKDPGVLPPGTPVADRRGMAHSGTLVTGGAGAGVVVATGANTEIGLIHGLVRRTVAPQTPLTRKIAKFGRVVTVAVLALSAVTFAVGTARGRPADAMLTAAIALAVGAIPEGLPAMVTITLAFGVARMVRRNVIVRRLPVVETLGGTTVICADKTGTLTENRMTVTTAVAAGRTYAVPGAHPAAGAHAGDGATGTVPGAEAAGGAGDGGRADPAGARPAGTAEAAQPLRAAARADVALRECLLAGAACNDAHLPAAGEPTGDPTEIALLVSAAAAGLDAVPPRLDTVPFSSERRFMATLHPGTVYVKGSPERVLELCDGELLPDGGVRPLDPRAVRRTADRLGAQGLRVLAFARAGVPPATTALAENALPPLVFAGLQGMADPPRTASPGAVRACLDAGIAVKMITGDHVATARAVAARVGLEGPPVTGAELAGCADDRLPELAERTTVFARVSPGQKLRLVDALQSRGHVIAMTGDGVNDAPALRRADVGVAMGRGGTEVAKEAADVVLTDDDFASIKAAVEEGRGVFDNLTRFLVWALPANVGLGLVLVAAIMTGAQPPILPLQVLWLNTTAVLVLGLPFAVEPADPEVMRRPPRDPARPLLTAALGGRVLLVAAILLAGAFGLFHWEPANGASLAQARTVVVNVFAVTLAAYLFNCLSLDRPTSWARIRRNPSVVAAVLALAAIQLLYTYMPFAARIFGSAPLGGAAWLRVVAVAVTSYVLVEAVKAVQPRHTGACGPSRRPAGPHTAAPGGLGRPPWAR